MQNQNPWLHYEEATAGWSLSHLVCKGMAWVKVELLRDTALDIKCNNLYLKHFFIDKNITLPTMRMKNHHSNTLMVLDSELARLDYDKDNCIHKRNTSTVLSRYLVDIMFESWWSIRLYRGLELCISLHHRERAEGWGEGLEGSTIIKCWTLKKAL